MNSGFRFICTHRQYHGVDAAEAELEHVAPFTSQTPVPTSDLLHELQVHQVELQVHQVELEMQNESLRQAQIALEESRDQYLELYEFAPVGFLTISREGLIIAINLTGTALLGEDRQKLLNLRFAHCVAESDQDG